MRNYIKAGHTQTFVAPMGGVVSGRFYVHGDLVVLATHDAAVDENYEGQISGVVEVAKDGSDAWVHGELVYLKAASATTFNTTSGGGNTLAGKAAGATGAGAGETTGYVLLNGLPGPRD